ncbi:MAG TPA: Calx-beta domain-containing protein [Thermoanaerobaculia bacterium]|nr:Calx-beta domain-containing protein [Thermoanaerobaculia bacterium]
MKARILLLLLGIALFAAAAQAQAQPVISFETNEIVVSNSTGRVAMLLEGTRQLIGVKEADGDGLVHFPIPRGPVMNAVAVDLASGEIGFNAIGTTPQGQSLPAGLIMHGTSGTWSRFVLPNSITRFLVIRPVVGAWGQVTASLPDEDETNNTLRFTQLSALQTWFGTGPTTGVQPGDLFVALGGSSLRMTGVVQLTPSPGVISFASPSSYSVDEGSSREIVLMRTIGTDGTVSVRLRTLPGTATPGVDYNAFSQTVTFNPGEAIKKLTFQTINDDAYAGTPTLTLELLDATGTTIGGTPTRIVEISGNDPAPVIAFGNVPASVAEQHAPWVLNVPVTLTGKTRVSATANYAILRDGLAGPTGQVTIPAGQTTASIPLNIPGNTTPEANYEFTIMLNPGTNATVGVPNTAHITVTNDDVLGSLSVADVSVPESSASAPFQIALAQAMTQEVRVSYATFADEATAGSDFVAKSGVAIFPPGQTSVIVNVEILNDSSAEPDEKFRFTIYDPAGATITRATAFGTIRNDDTADLPQIGASDLSVQESAPVAVLTLRITPPGNRAASVSWTTANGTATAGQDYVANSGSATFTETQNIIIPIMQDSQFETSETFYVDFTSVSNATLERQRVAITILDDDQVTPARVSVADTTVIESTGTDTTATFRVTLASPVSSDVRVTYATADITASSGLDYASRFGTVTINAGQTAAEVTVPVFGDGIAESDETFRLTLSNPVNATFARETAVATIQDDDSGPRPSLSIEPVQVLEGNDAVFIVALSAASSTVVQVDFATANGNAIEGVDYIPAAGTLVFAPGELSKSIFVTVIEDSIAEPQEQFTVALTNASGALLARPNAEATIVDDDATRRRSARH